MEGGSQWLIYRLIIAEETFWPSELVDREPGVHKYLANLSKGKKKIRMKRVKVVCSVKNSLSLGFN